MIPIKVSDKLTNELMDKIDSGEIIHTFTLKRYLKEAESILEYDLKKMTCALAYAAAGMYEEANEQFRLAMQTNNEVIIRNYMVYLLQTNQIRKYMQEAIKYSSKIKSIHAQYIGLNYAIFFLDKEKATDIYTRLVRLEPEMSELSSVHVAHYISFMDNIDKMLKSVNMDISNAQWLNEQIINICERNKVAPFIINHYKDNIDNGMAFITGIESSDPELIANLNFELAMTISTNDHLLSNGITAWFKGMESDKVHSI